MTNPVYLALFSCSKQIQREDNESCENYQELWQTLSQLADVHIGLTGCPPRIGSNNAISKPKRRLENLQRDTFVGQEIDAVMHDQLGARPSSDSEPAPGR